MQELNSPIAFRKDEPHLAIIKIGSGPPKKSCECEGVLQIIYKWGIVRF